MTALPIEITLHDIPRWQPLVTRLHEGCADLASQLGEPGHWQVVVEQRRSGEVVARLRVDWTRGSRHAYGRDTDPLSALTDAFTTLAADLPLPMSKAG